MEGNDNDVDANCIICRYDNDLSAATDRTPQGLQSIHTLIKHRSSTTGLLILLSAEQEEWSLSGPDTMVSRGTKVRF